MTQSPGPLDGIRIVDLTSMLSGPWATMILADQGADVIKVEEPRLGDHTRAYGNRRNGFSASFLNLNRNNNFTTSCYCNIRSNNSKNNNVINKICFNNKP